MVSVFSLQATVLKPIYSQELVGKKEMFAEQMSLFCFGKGCVKLEDCSSNLSQPALCYVLYILLSCMLSTSWAVFSINTFLSLGVFMFQAGLLLLLGSNCLALLNMLWFTFKKFFCCPPTSAWAHVHLLSLTLCFLYLSIFVICFYRNLPS